MIPRAAHLLPHEAECQSCEDGFVDVVHPCTSSAAEEPSLATGRREPCSRCDGTRIVVDKHRSRNRATDSIADEFTRLRNQVAHEHAVAVELGTTVARLIEENRKLRELTTSLPASSRVPNSSAQGFEGAGSVDAPSFMDRMRGGDLEC